jgi:hypothetical protein
MNEKRLTEIENALEALTGGRWFVAENGYVKNRRDILAHQTYGDEPIAEGVMPDDAAFIAATPTYITELLEEVKQLRAALREIAKMSQEAINTVSKNVDGDQPLEPMVALLSDKMTAIGITAQFPL